MLRFHVPELGDIPRILDCMRTMHAESGPYSKYAFAADDAEHILKTVIGDPHPDKVFGMVATDDHADLVVGMIFAEVVDDLWTAARITSDHGIYIRSEYRGQKVGHELWSRYLTWAKAHADIVRVAVNAGINDELGGEFMRAHGLQPRGTFYGMEF